MMLNGASNIFQNLNSNSDEETIKKSTDYYEYLEKGSTIEFKVADNTYNMDIVVDIFYLLQLAEIIDFETITDNKVQLTLKINDKVYFDGITDLNNILKAESIGSITGKDTVEYKV